MPEIQNPNLQSGGPGDKRGGDFSSLILMGFLAVAIFLGFQYFERPKTPAPQPAQQQQQSQSQQAANPAQSASGSSAAPAAAAQSVATPTIAAASQSTTIVDNPDYRIEFTNKGALVKHWILKHYNDSSGHPLDMVQQQASDRFGFPLSLFTYEPALSAQLNQALYKASATGTLKAPAQITFHYAQNGVDVVKTFTFGADYVIHAAVQVRQNGQPVRALLAWPAGLGDQEEFQGHSSIPGLRRTPSTFDWSIEGKSDSESASKVSNNATLEGDYQYAATADLYFAAAFLPDDPAAGHRRHAAQEPSTCPPTSPIPTARRSPPT